MCSKKLFHCFLLLSSYFLIVVHCHCNPLSHREVTIVNDTDIAFSLQPYPFGNAYFTPFSYDLKQYSRVDFSVTGPNSLEPANGIVVFMLSGHYVFSLVMKDQIVSVHGCKSKGVFYHPADYVCTLTDNGSNGKTLRVKRSYDR